MNRRVVSPSNRTTRIRFMKNKGKNTNKDTKDQKIDKIDKIISSR